MFAKALGKAQAKLADAPAPCPNGYHHDAPATTDGKQLETAVFALG